MEKTSLLVSLYYNIMYQLSNMLTISLVKAFDVIIKYYLNKKIVLYRKKLSAYARNEIIN